MSEIEPNAAGPEPEEDDEDASLERRRAEEAQRGPGGADPDDERTPGSDSEA
jgi:hypothetical protein